MSATANHTPRTRFWQRLIFSPVCSGDPLVEHVDTDAFNANGLHFRNEWTDATRRLPNTAFLFGEKQAVLQIGHVQLIPM